MNYIQVIKMCPRMLEGDNANLIFELNYVFLSNYHYLIVNITEFIQIELTRSFRVLIETVTFSVI